MRYWLAAAILVPALGLYGCSGSVKGYGVGLKDFIPQTPPLSLTDDEISILAALGKEHPALMLKLQRHNNSNAEAIRTHNARVLEQNKRILKDLGGMPDDEIESTVAMWRAKYHLD